MLCSSLAACLHFGLQHLHAAAAMAGTTALPLQQFFATLDNSCLPKILQVCSGVYFQGSIYEISGSEVCFSTGDLIKVLDIELQSVCCEEISKNEKFELPINHTGLFKVVPEHMPYSSIGEMMKLRPIGVDSSLPFTFTGHTKITIDDFTLGPGKALTVKSIERGKNEEEYICCHVQGQQNASADVRIPFSTRGEFYECESDECFSLQEIMSSFCLRSRRFRFINTAKCQQSLLLSPVYQIHAIMNMRKNVFKFPSSLEVDVVDVTDDCHLEFITPLSLTEVFSHPDESFPAVVDILEAPDSNTMFKCSWISGLKKNHKLLFHKKGTSAMVLISSSKSKKTQQYFLVSQQYGGRFKKRPREFNSVYEIYAASVSVPGLRVSVTRNCEEIEEEGIPSLSVGEQLEIVRCERMEVPDGNSNQQKQTVEALLCYRLADIDEDEEDNEQGGQEDKEEIYLPLYMQCYFVEVLTDNKKYKLKDLGKDASLPLDVKVSCRDSDLENDPLATFSCLKIEAAMIEPVIQASFPDSPSQCFDLPLKWLSMCVCFTKDNLPWPSNQPPKYCLNTVTEVTDVFLYEFRKHDNSDGAPPPRPPKRNLTSSKSLKKSKPSKKNKNSKSKHQAECLPTKEFSDLTIGSKKRPPAPPPPDDLDKQLPPVIPPRSSNQAQPNTYVKMQDSLKKVPFNTAADLDSDHDYETIDSNFSTIVKEAQENILFY